MDKYTKIKRSYGIALCNRLDSPPCMLMVKRRYTYAYSIFVHAQYRSDDRKYIQSLLNNMTPDEKIDLASMSFDTIWRRIWQDLQTQSYASSKKRFESTYSRDDGRALKAMINKSSSGRLYWELPKGRKNSDYESDVNCAVRELYEETGVKKSSYRLFDGAVSTTHTDANTTYESKYYFASIVKQIKPVIRMYSGTQVIEVCDVRWMTSDELRFAAVPEAQMLVCKKCMRYVKKYTS